MLVLTRKPGQQILVGDDIVLTFLPKEGDQIRVGIDAPLSVNIVRKEIVGRDRNLSTKSVDKAVEKGPKISYKPKVKPWKDILGLGI